MTWLDKLSQGAKAEILQGVLHQLEDDYERRFSLRMRIAWFFLPPAYKKMVRDAVDACSIWHADLTPEDYANIREWFRQQKVHVGGEN